MAQSALAAFGNGELYVEQYIPEIRHIEVQIAADSKGNTVHFGRERLLDTEKASKLIEEAPSPVSTEKFRKKSGAGSKGGKGY